jgi:hypothetical protein
MRAGRGAAGAFASCAAAAAEMVSAHKNVRVFRMIGRHFTFLWVIDNWLGGDSVAVLGGNFTKSGIDFV